MKTKKIVVQWRKIKSLRNDDDDNNVKKIIGFKSKTTALHVHHAFSTFRWRPLHDYDVKPPKETSYGGRGHTTTIFPFSISTWINDVLYRRHSALLIEETRIKHLRIQLPEKSPTFDELSGSKLTQLSLKGRKFLFFSDAFTAVVVVVA